MRYLAIGSFAAIVAAACGATNDGGASIDGAGVAAPAPSVQPSETPAQYPSQPPAPAAQLGVEGVWRFAITDTNGAAVPGAGWLVRFAAPSSCTEPSGVAGVVPCPTGSVCDGKAIIGLSVAALGHVCDLSGPSRVDMISTNTTGYELNGQFTSTGFTGVARKFALYGLERIYDPGAFAAVATRCAVPDC